MWFSSTLWQGQGKTKIQLIVDPNEGDEPRNAVLDCHFYLPQSNRKVVEHVKILQDAPIKSGIAGVPTTNSLNYPCRWEGDVLHVAAPEGAKVEAISLEDVCCSNCNQSGFLFFAYLSWTVRPPRTCYCKGACRCAESISC